MIVRVGCVLLVAVACSNGSGTAVAGSGSGSASPPKPPATGSGSAAPAKPPVPTVPVAERAKKIFDAQLAALRDVSGSDAFLATFRDDAIVLVPDGRAVKTKELQLHDAIDYVGPQDGVRSIKVDTLVVGGNADAVWWNATIVVTVKKPRTVRVTELAVAPDWKVVAAAFTDNRTPSGMVSGRGSIDAATKAGPLAPLLVAPTDADTALATDAGVAVFGTDKAEAAFGTPAAHKLLGTWKKLKLSLEGTPREVREASWGYVQANVNWDSGERFIKRMAGMLIAVPAADGRWQVVAINFGGL